MENKKKKTHTQINYIKVIYPLFREEMVIITFLNKKSKFESKSRHKNNLYSAIFHTLTIRITRNNLININLKYLEKLPIQNLIIQSLEFSIKDFPRLTTPK